jgi:hypothetical protein
MAAQPKLYAFSTTIGAACAQRFVTFADLADTLKIDVVEVMRQCNGKTAPTKALVKGVAKRLEIDEGSFRSWPMKCGATWKRSERHGPCWSA